MIDPDDAFLIDLDAKGNMKKTASFECMYYEENAKGRKYTPEGVFSTICFAPRPTELPTVPIFTSETSHPKKPEIPMLNVTRDNINPRSIVDLNAVNAHIQEAGKTYFESKRRMEARLKEFKLEVKKMSDHELALYINLKRVRINSLEGNLTATDRSAMTYYQIAMEERDARRERQ